MHSKQLPNIYDIVESKIPTIFCSLIIIRKRSMGNTWEGRVNHSKRHGRGRRGRFIAVNCGWSSAVAKICIYTYFSGAHYTFNILKICKWKSKRRPKGASLDNIIMCYFTLQSIQARTIFSGRKIQKIATTAQEYLFNFYKVPVFSTKKQNLHIYTSVNLRKLM